LLLINNINKINLKSECLIEPFKSGKNMTTMKFNNLLKISLLFSFLSFCNIQSFSQDTMIAQFNFEEDGQGWSHQAYTDIGGLIANPTGGWIPTVNWANGGIAGSYRHNNAPNANGAWFMFSPNMVLEAGEEYYVKFGATLAGANTPQLNSRVQVRWLQTSNQPPYSLLSFTILLGSTYIDTQGGVNGYVEFTSPTFTAPSSGDYRFAVGDFFNANAWACYYDGIRIFKVGSSGEQCDFSISPSSVSICEGQSINLTASGQATNYAWLPAAGLSANNQASVTASPLSTTTYTVTGTNGACSSTQTVTVQVNSNPTVIIQADNTDICTGSSVFLNASGAESYVWSPATGLSATTGQQVSASPSSTTLYQVTGTSGNCSSTAQININVNPNPNIQISPLNPSICLGGAVNLSATGANSYSWTPSNGLNTMEGSDVIASPVASTLYTVTGSSNGCSSIANVEVSVLNASPIVITPSFGAVCLGDSLFVEVNAGAEVIWTPSEGVSFISGNTYAIFPQTSTNYTLSGSGNTCLNDAAFNINIVSNPDAQFSYQQTVDYTVQFSNTSPDAVSFLWNFGGGNTSTQANPTFTFPFDGNYDVTLIVSNICGSDTITISVEVLKLSANSLNSQAVRLFPNPASSLLQLASDVPITEIRMLDATGRTILVESVFMQFQYQLSIDQLPPGVYFLQCSSRDYGVIHKRFVKK
jgi:hypothetical protein